MHPRCQEIADHLDHHRAELHAAVASIPPERHAIAPADGQWSVLAVLEHLVIVEGRVGKMLEKQILDAKAAGAQAETDATPILPQLKMAMFTDRTRKIKGSDAVQPRLGPRLDELWQSMDTSRASIKRLLVVADGMRLGNLTMPHPTFGPLDLYTWFAFIGAHEARHAAQIREIGATVATL
ncbi:MAG TPA: DinB family protein [Gemmatimonadaceae bacterium]|jgi:uncharacterized damage-inducible protein DinB